MKIELIQVEYLAQCLANNSRKQVILYLFQSQVSAGGAIEIAKEVDQRENRSLPMKG